MLGMLTNDKTNPVKANIPSKDKSKYSQKKYKFLLEAPFDVSNKCCYVMKKSPVYSYARKTKRNPITAQMASESMLRTQKWLQNGCNGFNMTRPISNPMAFWTEQDVLWYIKLYNIPICSVYGDVTTIDGGETSPEDLETGESCGVFDKERPTLCTTGCERTGCMFCLYGAHLEDGEGRLVKLKQTHPKQYNYIMKNKEDGGLNFKEVIDWTNEHGNLNIRY